MTCRRVPWVHPTCTCGAPLQLGVDHGDDLLGNPLCPTCSGCGCEPEERKTMNEYLTPEQLDALRPGAVLRDVNGWDAVKGVNGRWYPTDQGGHDTPGTPPYTVIHPAPEPDHSMCARLEPDCESIDGLRRWVLREPAGGWLGNYSDTRALSSGFAIPEPEPTVIERAAKVLAEHVHMDHSPLQWMSHANALASAGLLKDDDQ